ncbi:MAG: hypothetical protein H7Z74_00745 [Anaerolineae bacterium]|nr:hypothetical protein [Gemmatimonadaceae bacterium]
MRASRSARDGLAGVTTGSGRRGSGRRGLLREISTSRGVGARDSGRRVSRAGTEGPTGGGAAGRLAGSPNLAPHSLHAGSSSQSPGVWLLQKYRT